MKLGLEAIKNKRLIKDTGFINGKFIDHGSRSLFPVFNPATGEKLIDLPRMGVEDAEKAIQASKHAWKSWREVSSKERSKALSRMADLMMKNKDDLAALITLEAGKPMKESLGEIMYAHSFYEFYSEEAKRVNGEILQPPNHGRRLLALRQSVGPAALITPWNFPSAMITRKVGPALAAGCSVVIKPAEDTPLSALALCVIAEEAGVPPGVVNCLTVARDEVVEVGKHLCNSKDIRKISFTGSTSVGKWLMRESASTVKRVKYKQYH
jgi:succinate-semialdehyde dehydrogenase/glutarate-semialdehyde dehydrogenase